MEALTAEGIEPQITVDDGIRRVDVRHGSAGLKAKIEIFVSAVPTHTTEEMQHNLKAIGWWSLTRTKIEESKADLWVFVIPSFFHPERQFILMTPKELLDILNRVHGSDAAKIQSYFSVTTKNRCWESRGLNKDDEESMAMHRYENQARDCTKYLNNWNALTDRMKEKAEPAH